MNEEEYLMSCRLQNQLRDMQHDLELSQTQRKLANEYYKELMLYPQFPSVHPRVVKEMIQKVKKQVEMMFLRDLHLLVKIEKNRFGEYIVIPKGKGKGLLPEQKRIYSLRKRER